MIPEELRRIVQEENEKLAPVLAEVTVGMMPIRVFLLERYVDAMKSSKDFDNEIYHIISMAINSKMYCAECSKNGNPEKVKRMLKTRAMIDEIGRSNK